MFFSFLGISHCCCVPVWNNSSSYHCFMSFSARSMFTILGRTSLCLFPLPGICQFYFWQFSNRKCMRFPATGKEFVTWDKKLSSSDLFFIISHRPVPWRGPAYSGSVWSFSRSGWLSECYFLITHSVVVTGPPNKMGQCCFACGRVVVCNAAGVQVGRRG